MNGEYTGYVWNGSNLAAETNDSAVTNTYTYGVGGIVSANMNGVTSLYLKNVHGDVVGMTDAAGIIQKTYRYDAFGNEQTKDENDQNPFRYCGEYYDGETGNTYLRNRYYSPNIGRFITEDPIRDGMNWYIYANNNPVIRIDPSGNSWIKDRLNDAWNGAQWAFKTFGNYANELQKSVQRNFWKTGSQLLLRDHFGYETSAWLLEHSLQNNPSSVYRGDDSRIAELIKADRAFTAQLDSVMTKYATGSSFTTPGIQVSFNSGDLYYSIHTATITFNGTRQEDGSWIISCSLYDKYDYTEFTTMMKNSGDYDLKVSLGTVANDAAVISQKTGAIQTYDIYVNFTVWR